MSTPELIAYAKKNEGLTFEAELLLNHGARSTHYLCWWKSRLEDEGCDGVRGTTSAKRFLEMYEDAQWALP